MKPRKSMEERFKKLGISFSGPLDGRVSSLEREYLAQKRNRVKDVIARPGLHWKGSLS